ncbi:TPA: replication protein RepA [Pseudomonas putida]
MSQNDAPLPKLTKREERLIAAGVEIEQNPPSGDDFAFTHSVLCQVGLPRSKVDGRDFLRRSGDAWLSLSAGYLDEGAGPVEQPLPYGPMPRIALAHISTFAVRHRTTEIPIGDSAAEFLRLMGMDRQGARYHTLRTQMHALAACRLQLGFKGRTYNGEPIRQFDAWMMDHDTGQRSLWPGLMRLSENYFESLKESAVPLDMRALHDLKGSALQLDIYTWLAHRLHRIEGRGVMLYWKNLRDQFAQEYHGKDPDKDFKKEFSKGLEKVLVVYPKARVNTVRGGLLLLPSDPPVPYKPIPSVTEI